MNQPTRRQVVQGAAGIAALCAVGGVGVVLAGDTELLRPPGGQNEVHFMGSCLRCDRCRSVCPQRCITLGTIENGLVNARTPYLDFRKGACDFCGKCEEVCPTGSLLPGFDYKVDKLGVALVDEGECLAFGKAGGCIKCVDACPYDAITKDSSNRPIVDQEKCNGCGVCENVCPSQSLRSFDGSQKRGINVVKGSA